MPKRKETSYPNDEVDVASTRKQAKLSDGDGDNQPSIETKVFNDSVHGHIELHPLLVDIIDTPEFQRLRFIKQLGMCHFVYPGAVHTRFEHSLGVSYLAGQLARSLQSKQQDLDIDFKDILCVEIAGLCHDLGHGPFSHMFDNIFLKKLRPDFVGKHEELSVKMFEHMLKKNNLREKFKLYKLTETDIIFIKEQIVGVGEIQPVFKGRDDKKRFLYEIVANKRNGIDVDKWDYFARDSLYLGLTNPFDWRRCLTFARVLEDNGEMQICTRDKEITSMYDLFHTRYALHRRACQHRVTKILEVMMAEALEEANDYLFFQGQDEILKMSKCIDDMEAYSRLTDNVMWQIYSSTDKDLKTSRDIIDRILKRDLFVCIGQTQISKNNTFQETVVRNGIYRELQPKAEKELKEIDINVHFVKFDYGMEEEDPVRHVKFYSKYDVKNAVRRSDIKKDSISLPEEFCERFLRVCVKQADPQICEWVEEAFKSWCTKNRLMPKPGEFSAGMSWIKKPPPSVRRETQVDKVKKELDFGLNKK